MKPKPIKDKKLKAVKYIPTFVIQYTDNEQYEIITSTMLYDDQKTASDVMEVLLNKYSHYRFCKIVRWQVVTKIISL